MREGDQRDSFSSWRGRPRVPPLLDAFDADAAVNVACDVSGLTRLAASIALLSSTSAASSDLRLRGAGAAAAPLATGRAAAAAAAATGTAVAAAALATAFEVDVVRRPAPRGAAADDDDADSALCSSMVDSGKSSSSMAGELATDE